MNEAHDRPLEGMAYVGRAPQPARRLGFTSLAGLILITALLAAAGQSALAALVLVFAAFDALLFQRVQASLRCLHDSAARARTLNQLLEMVPSACGPLDEKLAKALEILRASGSLPPGWRVGIVLFEVDGGELIFGDARSGARRFPIAYDRDVVGALCVSGLDAGADASQCAFVTSFADAIGKLVMSDRREQALIRATEAARAGERAKAEFLANMSHEIRTPMNGILSCCALLLTGDHDEETTRRLEIIRSCGDSLMTVIDDILDFSRIESGKLAFESRPFDPGRQVDELVGLFFAEADAKGRELCLRLDPSLPLAVCGDENRFRQIVQNLLSNAIKFAETRVETTVRSQPLEGEAVRLQVIVQDDGIGIPAEAQQTIFESFAQVDASTSRRYGGTGLGLAICRRLVDAMGGQIGVESEEGQGACFSFSLDLPIAKALPQRPKPFRSRPAVRSQGREGAGAETLRVLVAEDNPINRVVAQGVLETLGYAPDLVEHGRAAVEAVCNGHYDVVLMDVHMPEMDGIEATRAIREAYPDAALRIIALSASVLPDDRELCSDAGMDGFLAKPLEVEALGTLLAELSQEVGARPAGN